MPFDGTDFRFQPEQPQRNPRRERAWALIVGVLAVVLLVMPVSAAGMVDIVRYIRGH